MSEKAAVSTEKKNGTQGENSSARIKRPDNFQLPSPSEGILFLQRTVGNYAVGRLIRSGAFQTKLRIGQPGDEYEQEADRVADAVMRMTDIQVGKANDASYIRRDCHKCREDELKRQPIKEEEDEEKIRRQPKKDEEDEEKLRRQPAEEEDEEKLQAKGSDIACPESIENQISSLRGGGNPLSEGERAFFEPRFGADFGQVRVHTDAMASETAQALNARAYTIGNDMIFGRRQYEPGHILGKKLIAHELTHVIQQRNRISFPFKDIDDNLHMDKSDIQSTGKISVIQRSIINVTLPDGKMIKVDCETPPPSVPGLAPAPCEEKDLKTPKGKQKTACQNNLKIGMADINVKKIIKKLKSIKGCKVPKINCKKCTGACEGGGAWQSPNVIDICANTNPGQSEMIGYLKHELTHQLQDCRHSPDVDCKDGMKNEIEAYKAEGVDFKTSFGDSVWSSCYSMRCKDSDINKGLADAMKKYYDSL